MKGYYEGYSYVGFMLNGKKMRFATEQEYVEAYEEEEEALYKALSFCLAG